MCWSTLAPHPSYVVFKKLTLELTWDAQRFSVPVRPSVWRAHSQIRSYVVSTQHPYLINKALLI